MVWSQSYAPMLSSVVWSVTVVLVQLMSYTGMMVTVVQLMLVQAGNSLHELLRVRWDHGMVVCSDRIMVCTHIQGARAWNRTIICAWSYIAAVRVTVAYDRIRVMVCTHIEGRVGP